MHRALVLSLVLAGSGLLTACAGDDASTSSRDEVVQVEMVDNAYEPEEIEVQAGEEVTFVFENGGSALHEAYIGDEEAQDDHADEMADEGGMEMGHGDGHGGSEAIEVDPGDDGELTYTFDEPGEYLIGCHQPGHYEDGMRMTVTVT